MNSTMQSENPTVEIWADSVSLQPFTKKQWTSHQQESIERVSKSIPFYFLLKRAYPFIDHWNLHES